MYSITFSVEVKKLFISESTIVSLYCSILFALKIDIFCNLQHKLFTINQLIKLSTTIHFSIFYESTIDKFLRLL